MMKKRMCIFFLLCFSITQLVACTGQSEEEKLANGFREEYIAMETCGGKVSIHGDYGSRVYDYLGEFTWRAEEGLSLTLTEPEILAGMTATVAEGETALSFDGITMETGKLNETGLAPLDSITVMLSYLQEGYMLSCGAEDLGDERALRLELITGDEALDETMNAIVWLSGDTGDVMQCELCCDDFTVIALDFEDFHRE